MAPLDVESLVQQSEAEELFEEPEERWASYYEFRSFDYLFEQKELKPYFEHWRDDIPNPFTERIFQVPDENAPYPLGHFMILQAPKEDEVWVLVSTYPDLHPNPWWR
jgi:hypothetical protein